MTKKISLSKVILDNKFSVLKKYKPLHNFLNEENILNFISMDENAITRIPGLGDSKMDLITEFRNACKESFFKWSECKTNDEKLNFLFHHIKGILANEQRNFVGLFDFLNFYIYEFGAFNGFKGEYLNVFNNLLQYRIDMPFISVKEIAENHNVSHASVRNWRDFIIKNETKETHFSNLFWFATEDELKSLLKEKYPVSFEKGFLKFDFEKIRTEESVSFSDTFIAKILMLIHNEEISLIGDENDATTETDSSNKYLNNIYFVQTSVLNFLYSGEPREMFKRINQLFNDRFDNSKSQGNRMDYWSFRAFITEFAYPSPEVLEFVKELLDKEFTAGELYANTVDDKFLIHKGITVQKAMYYGLKEIGTFARKEEVHHVISNEPYNYTFDLQSLINANLPKSRVVNLGKVGLFACTDIANNIIPFDFGNGTRRDLLTGMITHFNRPVHIYSFYLLLRQNNIFFEGDEDNSDARKHFANVKNIIYGHFRNDFEFLEGGFIYFKGRKYNQGTHKISRKALNHLRILHEEGTPLNEIEETGKELYKLTKAQVAYILDRDISFTGKTEEFIDFVDEEEDTVIAVCPVTFVSIPEALEKIEINGKSLQVRRDIANLFRSGMMSLNEDFNVILDDTLLNSQYRKYLGVNLKVRIEHNNLVHKPSVV